MKVAFFSNYLNHHQTGICESLYETLGGNFRFVACEPMEASRLELGYTDMDQAPYVIRAYEGSESSEEVMKWCMESDVVIHGSAPEIYVTKRMEAGLPVFRYSERILKNGLIHALSPRALKNMYSLHLRYRNKPMYMLCASAFTAMDLHRYGAYDGKSFKWGYFPEVKNYPDIDKLLQAKRKNSLLWAGRLLDWKHPEAALKVAKNLKEEGYTFVLSIIGTGPMQGELERMIHTWGLQDCVALLGSMPPEKVREHMESSSIFLFTSDRGEGWGAVMNEAMNSGCAVVGGHIIGSVPFLIRDGENGLIYSSGNDGDLYNKVKSLLDRPDYHKQLGREAYFTMTDQWNAQNAAERFIKLAEAVCQGGSLDLFEDGVCSKAPLLKDGWYL